MGELRGRTYQLRLRDLSRLDEVLEQLTFALHRQGSNSRSECPISIGAPFGINSQATSREVTRPNRSDQEHPAISILNQQQGANQWSPLKSR
jgi:hypothetical protein